MTHEENLQRDIDRYRWEADIRNQLHYSNGDYEVATSWARYFARVVRVQTERLERWQREYPSGVPMAHGTAYCFLGGMGHHSRSGVGAGWTGD